MVTAECIISLQNITTTNIQQIPDPQYVINVSIENCNSLNGHLDACFR